MNIEITRELDGIEPAFGILYDHCYACTVVYDCIVDPGDPDAEEAVEIVARLTKCDLWYLGAEDEWFDLLGIATSGGHAARAMASIALAVILEDAKTRVSEDDVAREAIEKYHDAMADRAA